MNYLDSLNRAQTDAVETTEGPVRVLAGAGTGKTRALTARYCYLADLLGVDPSAILCLTFTNKAAAEMKNRIRRNVGDFDTGYVCTFHSFCVRMLKEDIHVLNYPANFTVIDEDDRNSLLLKVYEDMQLTLKEQPLKKSIAYIEKRKAGGEYLATIAELNNEELLARSIRNADREEEIFLRFLYEQKKNYGLDFDDLIIFAEHILRTFPDVLCKWQERMQYVMVDEFQDVSRRQYSIARMLAGAHRNLFIVGDPDQTIYTWRGADVNLILNFDKDYPDCRTIVLTENYRSTPQILAVSNSLIGHNMNRYPKALTAVGAEGPKPVFNHARDDKKEARWMADTIMELIAEGFTPEEIAILYRAHHLSRPIEDEFIRRSIPYKIYSGTAFYARQEVKDVTCYLRMLTTADDMAFVRTVNIPSRKIGKKKMQFLQAEAARTGASLMDTLRDNIDNPIFARTGARAYLRTIDTLRPLVGRIPLGDLMQRMLDMSGYEEMLRNLSEWERLDNLAELKRAIEEAGHDDDASLDEFLARIALLSNLDLSDARKPEGGWVRLMTIHSAKGMEFPAVFVVGLVEGNMPSKRSANPDDIEEERRLAYVALTRAERRLYLSDSEGFGHDNTAKQPSRFVYEMGPKHMTLVRPLPQQNKPARPLYTPQDNDALSSGDLVEHPVFGRGMVMEVDVAGQKYTVQFERFDTPRSMRFGAPLDKITP